MRRQHWVIGFACAGVLLVTLLDATDAQVPPPPPGGRAAQVAQPARGRAAQAARIQVPVSGQIRVRRPTPGQQTQLVISVANGGLAEGQSAPTEAGRAMLSRFIASLREVDNTLDSYLFLVHSYSTPRAAGSNTGERGQQAATAVTSTTAAAAAARTQAVTGAAAGRNSAAAAARATRPADAVAQPQSGRGAAAAAAAPALTPQMMQRLQVVQTYRGSVQTGRATAIQRLLVDGERVAADRIKLYAHGESRPEAPEPDAPPGDYVRIQVHRLMAMMSGGDPESQTMMLMSGDVSLPAFPWPPPRATSKSNLPTEWLRLQNPPTLGHVGQLLETALTNAGYPDYAYLAVPNGFTLVAKLEQIEADGTVTTNRWSNNLPSMAEMGFLEFVAALFRAPTGHYRVIAFIVTDVQWQQNAPRPTDEQAQQWLSMGLNALPAAVRDMPYTGNYQSTALVYQFTRNESGAKFVDAGTADTMTHLGKAGLLQTLKK